LISNEYIILYSHGNATNIGDLYDTLKIFSYVLKCSVIGYDYTGFEKGSKDKPDDFNNIDDIISVYKYLINNLGYK